MMEKKKIKDIDIKTYINSEKGFSLAEVAVGLAVVGIATAAFIGWQINESKHSKAQEIASILSALDTGYYQVSMMVNKVPTPTYNTMSSSTSTETPYTCILKNTSTWKNLAPWFVGDMTYWIGSLDGALNFHKNTSSYQFFLIDKQSNRCSIAGRSGTIQYISYPVYSGYACVLGSGSGTGGGSGMSVFHGIFGRTKLKWSRWVRFVPIGDLDYYRCGIYNAKFNDYPVRYFSDGEVRKCGWFKCRSEYRVFADTTEARYRSNSYTLCSTAQMEKTSPAASLPDNILDPRVNLKKLANEGYTYTFNVQGNKLTGISVVGLDDENNEILSAIFKDRWDKNTKTYKLNHGKGYALQAYRFSCNDTTTLAGR